MLSEFSTNYHSAAKLIETNPGSQEVDKFLNNLKSLAYSHLSASSDLKLGILLCEFVTYLEQLREAERSVGG